MGWVGVEGILTVAGSEFQSLEVIGIKELAKALVLFLFNLTAKGC